MYVKIVLFIAALFVFLPGCKKEQQMDMDNPNVEIFVKQLKNGTYKEFKKDKNGEQIWLGLPEFRQEHIASLIAFSSDTTHINDYPVNPILSLRPIPGGRSYFILGECLLSIVETIRGDVNPERFLVDASIEDFNERYKGVTTTEILSISNQYKQWWNNYKDGDWKANDPLVGTSYKWY